MKLILDIPLNKAFDFLTVLKNYPDIKTMPLSLSDAEEYNTFETALITAAKMRANRFNRRSKIAVK
ncbi:hypothetical protein KXD93_25590 [Mucilaginibacter sp. BJC16-A38]|uniref:hypothetical protein n=1 Tax=Mucilaginibacter phenanthrenivorans TaxID=1234842 RepID=UPI002157D3AB|nr:hypothetical protein [Mucilaginibacter phenanthrenivorans]MCR8561056.1 hypothetical protein [Mucilaginibacter phenanthrenivorans]